MIDREAHQPLDVGAHRDVGAAEQRRAALRGDVLHQAGCTDLVDVGDDDARAFGGERACACSADPLCSAGDEGDPILQLHRNLLAATRRPSSAAPGSIWPTA
jgi:hypothetical protein